MNLSKWYVIDRPTEMLASTVTANTRTGVMTTTIGPIGIGISTPNGMVWFVPGTTKLTAVRSLVIVNSTARRTPALKAKAALAVFVKKLYSRWTCGSTWTSMSVSDTSAALPIDAVMGWFGVARARSG